MKVKDIQPVLFEDGTLKIIDQTLLPGETRWLNLETKEQVWEAISRLQVRGAPAIGVTAAYGLYIGLRGSSATTYEELKKEFEAVKAYLASSRPTAVNLFWALDRMEACFSKKADLPVSRVLEALLLEAQAIRGEDEDNCRRLGEHGLSLLKPGMGLLTHCNAGALATARYGTALSPIYLGQEQGLSLIHI